MYIGNQPYQIAFVVDTFSGNNSTTVFTMSVAPANTASVLVVVSGVVQDPSTYSVSGTTLTFSGAPPSGTGNISARYLGIPASNVTTTAYRTVTNFTATSGQTTFTPPSYTAGFINVYRNGVYLPTPDYTATNGTTVVLNNGCTTGDTVTIESFLVSSVLNAIPATAGAVGSSYLASSLSLTTPTLTSPTMSGAVVSAMASSVITSGTSQATTSGTTASFTGIPSWAKRVTLMMNGVITNGTSPILLQVGSGSTTSSGYSSYGIAAYASGNSSTTSTAGFLLNSTANQASTTAYYGNIQLALLTSNTWVCNYSLGINAGGATASGGGGSIALSGALDRVILTTVTGTQTFTAGSINILYE